MELIIGHDRVVPMAMERIPGGVIAELTGPALFSMLDATRDGRVSVELYGPGARCRAMDVTEIRMHGATSQVTLQEKPGSVTLN